FDCGTEQEQSFRSKIRKYDAWFKSGVYRAVLETEAVTVAIATTGGEVGGDKRLKLLREWTRKETSLGATVYLANVADLPKPFDPRHLWLEPCWYTPDGQQPLALLAE